MEVNLKTKIFKRALSIYKYLTVILLILYGLYVLVDDFSLISEYWKSYWWNYLLLYLAYFCIFFWPVSLIYWIIYFVMFRK